MRDVSPLLMNEVALPATRATSAKFAHGAVQRSIEIAVWVEELLVHRSWILLEDVALALRLAGAPGAAAGGGGVGATTGGGVGSATGGGMGAAGAPGRPVWR